MPPVHQFERRAQLLSTRIQQRMTALRNAVTPPGERPPFSVQQTEAEAMDWWSKNRYSPIGALVLQAWTPEQVARLDVKLSDWHAQQAATPPPLGPVMDSPAMQQYQSGRLEPWQT